MSLVEAAANVVVGYGVAVLTEILVFPLFGLNATISQNLANLGDFHCRLAGPATCCRVRSKRCGRVLALG